MDILKGMNDVEIRMIMIFENINKYLSKFLLKLLSLGLAGNFSLHHHVQTSSGAHPASYPMDTRGSFLMGKAAGV
jgi:hypothetical protein